jgi:hypothetical protein
MRFLLLLMACSSTAPTVTPVSIANENALAGDTSWDIDSAGADDQLAAYARPLSVKAGERVSIQVNVSKTTQIKWSLFRLGWYGGAGARKVAEGVATAQPQPDPFIDPSTGLVECRWSPLFDLEVKWPSGMYLARVEAPDGGARWTYFLVKDERKADVILVMPTATDESYNDWGGESLYYDSRFGFPVGHAYEVSYDRPFSVGLGGGYLFVDAWPAGRYLEANGYDVTYLADTDVAADDLSRGKLVMVLAHDEYWSRAMRDRYEAARASGVNLAFMGANTGYWQVRFDQASDGMAERRQVGYKEAADLDPDHGLDLTTSFQLLDRPENSLLGIMSLDWHMVDFPWVVSDPTHWLYGGMNVNEGDLFAGVVGIETDGIVKNGRGPQVTVLADSPTIGGEALGVSHQQSTVYDGPDGNFVFAAGSIRFAATLSGPRAQLGAQRIVRNLIAHAGGAPALAENSIGAVDGMAHADLSRAAKMVSTFAGSTAGFADGPLLSAQFSSPMGIAAAPDGSLIVADAGNHAIRRIQGGMVSTVTRIQGRPWGVAVAADGSIWATDPDQKLVLHDGEAIAGDFGTPVGISVGSDARVWVTDVSSGGVKVIDGGNVTVVYPAGGALHFPSGIYAGEQIYLLDSGNRVLRILSPDGSLSNLAGSQEGGFADGSGDVARIAPLLGIAPLGSSLLIADSGNYRLRVVEPGADLKSSMVRTFAGAPRMSKSDGPGADAGLIAPTGIAVANGVVYISDTGNALIRAATP